jgi:hypothetical protein
MFQYPIIQLYHKTPTSENQQYLTVLEKKIQVPLSLTRL